MDVKSIEGLFEYRILWSIESIFSYRFASNRSEDLNLGNKISIPFISPEAIAEMFAHKLSSAENKFHPMSI